MRIACVLSKRVPMGVVMPGTGAFPASAVMHSKFE
jgi:hypothetical protein